MVDVLRKNLGIKIFSLLLAVFRWSGISRGSGGRQMEMSLSIPVEVQNLSSELEMVEHPAELVNVRFSGPRRIVSRIAQMGITLPLDLDGALEGITTFELYPGSIKAPEMTKVTRISPSSITIVLERSGQERFPVEPVLVGVPSRGFKVSAVAVDPLFAELAGPRSSLAGITMIQTAPVDIEGSIETIEREVGLVLPDDRVRNVDSSSVKVTVTVVPKGENQGKKKPQ